MNMGATFPRVHFMYLGPKIFGVLPGFFSAFGVQTNNILLLYLKFSLVGMQNMKPCTQLT